MKHEFRFIDLIKIKSNRLKFLELFDLTLNIANIGILSDGMGTIHLKKTKKIKIGNTFIIENQQVLTRVDPTRI